MGNMETLLIIGTGLAIIAAVIGLAFLAWVGWGCL